MKCIKPQGKSRGLNLAACYNGGMRVIIRGLLSPRMLKIARFVISGVTAMACNLGILFVLVRFGNVHYLPASVLAFIFSTAASFTLQKFWTFSDRRMSGLHFQFAKYSAVILFSLTVNTLLMYVLVEWFTVWYLVAQVLAGIVVALISYVGYQRLVFVEEKSVA